MPTRKASAEWKGTLKGGEGSFKGESGAVDASYSFGSRFEQAGGSNPEELLAAAEAACFSMALSVGLEQAGATPKSVRSEAACTVEKVGDGFKITKMDLVVRAEVEGIDAQKFQEVAQATKEGCPVSKALAGNVEISLDASLV